MNKLTLSAASILLATTFSNAAFALDKNTVAAVNGIKITQKQYQAHVKQRQAQTSQGKQAAPVSRQVILDELINREVLLQEAKKKKLYNDKKVKAQLEQVKTNLLIQALISQSPAVKQ